MTENKRFTYFKSKIGFGKQGIDDNLKGYTFDFTMDNVLDCMNELSDENEQLKQQRKELLRLIDNNIEIYENINTNVEFHQGEIQGKLTLLNNLRKVILND